MATTTPRVSVITPVYQSEYTLARTLDSLMCQTETRWESIIVDDGSPDGSWKVAEGFAHFDGRFSLLRRQNAGAGAARNAGIEQARGRYVLFLDADDWLEPGALACLADACDRGGWDGAHGSFRYVTNDGSPTDWLGAYRGSRPLFDALCNCNVLSMPAAVLVRRSALAETGGFDPSLKTCGDWDLWGRIARRYGNDIGHVDACVAAYRMRPRSLSHDPHALLGDAMRTMERLHDADPRVPRPNPQFAHGADRRELPLRRANLTLYAVGQAAAAGDLCLVDTLFDTITFWPMLSVTEAAGFLLSALYFARRQGPEGVTEFWPQVAADLWYVLRGVENRTGTKGIAERIAGAMDRLTGYQIGPSFPHGRPRLAETA